jgi:hypothetical protein
VVRVVVTTRSRELKNTLRLLERHGMIVDQILEAIGVITGRIPEPAISKLEKLEGIAVERDRDVDIGPPGAAPS